MEALLFRLRASFATLSLLCLIGQIDFTEQKSGKSSERSSDHSPQVLQSGATNSRLVLESFRLIHTDSAYIDNERTETKIIRLNETTQMVDGQWVIKKDIPLNAMVAWKFQRDNQPVMKKPVQNLCSEIIAPMTGLNLLYTNLGFTKCPIKKGVYSINRLTLPTLNVPKTIVSSNDKWTTTYEWLTAGKKTLLKFVAVARFVPN